MEKQIKPIRGNPLVALAVLAALDEGLEFILDTPEPQLHAPKVNLVGQRAKEQKRRIQEWLFLPVNRRTRTGKPIQIKERREFTRSLMHIKPLVYNFGTVLQQAMNRVQ
jgi:hypothetical protein